MPEYQRLRLRLPTELEEEIAAELWASGSLGLELRTCGAATLVDAYFDASAERLKALLESVSTRGAEVLAREALPDTDWLAVHRSEARPLEIGTRWLVDPREPDGPVPVAGDRETLRIPARRAFGTGSHESTRLLLEWLEELPVAGQTVLDLGTGSGILGLAAERLGAARVVGIDPDPVAVWMALENSRLNHGSLQLAAADLGCLNGGRFDLALVNILPAEWLDDAPRLPSVLADGATVLLSGIPLEQAAEFVVAVGACGLTVCEQRRDGEWVACRAESAG